MNKIRSGFKGLIYICSLLFISAGAYAHGYSMQGQWGTGFSGGMQGCMANTSAYGDASEEIQEAVASQAIADSVRRGLKKELNDVEDLLEEIEDKDSGSTILAIKKLPALLEAIEARAKQKKVGKIEIDSDSGAIKAVDVEGKEFDSDEVTRPYPGCDFGTEGHAAARRHLTSSLQIAFDNSTQKTVYKVSNDLKTNDVIKSGCFEATPPLLPTIDFDVSVGGQISEAEYSQLKTCVESKANKPGSDSIPSSLSNLGKVMYDKYVCPKETDEPISLSNVCNYAQTVGVITTNDNWDSNDCVEDVEKYFEAQSEISFLKDLQGKLKDQIKKAGKVTKKAMKDAEGDTCIDCLRDGYTAKQNSPSMTRTVIGALAGLTGQYLGLRAYKSAQNNAIDSAAKLGHTMNPIPNFNLYSGLGLSAISTISGLASGAYMCAGAGPYGGVHGMNNPYAMQMAMQGRGGAFGYNFGQGMHNPMMGMYMPGNFGGMGPMGLQVPFHMQGQMHPGMMAGMGPYASMMGPQAMFNPMASLGIQGMAGMPGAQFGMQGGFNPYGAMSPYGMMSPFGAGSAFAGMGAHAMNPYQMMNPSLYGGAGGLMSCIQAPCPGQLYNPYGGLGINGQIGLGGGLGGAGGFGGINPQMSQQQLQMQMQMLQRQQQQAQAYYQQIQQQTQQRLQASQQLTQLQQQMARLNQQAAQISAQAGIGAGGVGIGGAGGIGIGIGGGLGLPGIGGAGGINLGVGLGFGLGGNSMLWGGFPYGPGQFSPNSPVGNRGTNTR